MQRGVDGNPEADAGESVHDLDEHRFPVDWRSSYLLGAAEKDVHLILSAIFGSAFQSSASIGKALVRHSKSTD